MIDPRIAQWVASRIPVLDGFGASVSIGVWNGDDILAGVVFHDYSPTYRNIQVSIAAETPKWATRNTISRIMAYPFSQLKVNRVTSLIREGNSRSLKLCEGLGFKREGIVRKGFGDDNAIILGLLRTEAPDWMLRQV